MSGLAEVGLVIVIVALAMRYRTLKKEKNSCLSNCVGCKMRKREKEQRFLCERNQRSLKY
jgi:hypothetical protein